MNHWKTYLTFTVLFMMLPIPPAQAHMYVANSDLYIRIVEHPEMPNMYSYGLCRKKNYGITDKKRGVSMEQIRNQNHLHSDCIVPEGKYWWPLHNPQTYVKRQGTKDVLLDSIQADDMGRAYLDTFEIATFLLGWKAATTVTRQVFKQAVKKSGIVKRTIRFLGMFLLDGVVDGAIYAAFWEGGGLLTDKLTHDYYRKTQPFTQYKNWKKETNGVNDKGIEIDYDGRLNLPSPIITPDDQDCMEHCFENAMSIRNRLSTYYDDFSTLGLNLFANYPSEDPNLFETMMKYRGYDDVCTLRCEHHYRLPNMKELWFLVMTLLSKSLHFEYKRILFDVSGSPWSDPDWRITYVTPREIAKFTSRKDKRYGGLCPIGSNCDQKHKFQYNGPLSLDGRVFKKIDRKTLETNYSSNVYKSITNPIDHTLQYHHVPTELGHIHGWGDTIYIDKDKPVKQIEVYTAQGMKIFIDEYFYEDENVLEISKLASGMYYIHFEFEDENFDTLSKVFVSK